MPDKTVTPVREETYVAFQQLEPETTYRVRASLDPSFPLDATVENLVTTEVYVGPQNLTVPAALTPTTLQESLDAVNVAIAAGGGTGRLKLQAAGFSVEGTLIHLFVGFATNVDIVKQLQASSDILTTGIMTFSLSSGDFLGGVTLRNTTGSFGFSTTSAAASRAVYKVQSAPATHPAAVWALGEQSVGTRTRTRPTTWNLIDADGYLLDPDGVRITERTAGANPISETLITSRGGTIAPEPPATLPPGATHVDLDLTGSGWFLRFREASPAVADVPLPSAFTSPRMPTPIDERTAVLDSNLLRVAVFERDGSQVTTGPQPEGLATITVNGRTQVVLDEPGPFTRTLTILGNDLPYAPHIRLSATSLDPDAAIAVSPSNIHTFTDLQSAENVPVGTSRTATFTITVTSENTGTRTYTLAVTVVTGIYLPDVEVEEPDIPTGGDTGPSEPEIVVPPGDKPAITQFTVSPDTITTGEQAVLAWRTEAAETVTVKRGSTALSTLPRGDLVQSPAAGTYNYTISATNDNGTTTDAATLTVEAAPVDPDAPGRGASIDSFTADNYTIAAGGSTVLRWTTSRATVTINGTARDPDGTLTVRPAATSTYTLVATPTTAGAATQRRTLTVAVQADDPTPTIDTYTASRRTGTAGEEVRLTWTTTNATAVTLNGAAAALDGTVTRTLQGPTPPATLVTRSFILRAVNGANVETRTLTVNVAAADEPAPDPPPPTVVVPPPTISISFSAARITRGNQTTVTVNLRHATSLTINGTVTAGAETGSVVRTLKPVSTTVYTFVASGPGGTVSRRRTVTVDAVAPDPTARITASSREITEGESLTLRYSFTNTVTRTINGTNVPNERGSVTVSPARTSTYRATGVSRDGKRATASVSVKVIPRVLGKIERELVTSALGTNRYIYYIRTGVGRASRRVPLADQTLGASRLGQTWTYENVTNPLRAVFAAQGQALGITGDVVASTAVQTALSGLTTAQLLSSASCIYSCAPISASFAAANPMTLIDNNLATFGEDVTRSLVAQGFDPSDTQVADLIRRTVAKQSELFADFRSGVLQNVFRFKFTTALSPGTILGGLVLPAFGGLNLISTFGSILSATAFDTSPAALVSMLSQIDSAMAYINGLDGTRNFPSGIGDPATWLNNPTLTYSYDYDDPPSANSQAQLTMATPTPGVTPISGTIRAQTERGDWVRATLDSNGDATVVPATESTTGAFRPEYTSPLIRFVGTGGQQARRLIEDVVDYIDERLPPEFVAASRAAKLKNRVAT